MHMCSRLQPCAQVRFHLGSLAFGALLVALVQLVRLIFEWVDQQTKRLQQGSETAKVITTQCTHAAHTRIVHAMHLQRACSAMHTQVACSAHACNAHMQVAIKCTRCCLWCLEKCLQFITGYAYIFVALNGDSFCTAAHDTLRLLTAYPATALLSHYVQSLLFAVQSLLLPGCMLTHSAALVVPRRSTLAPSSLLEPTRCATQSARAAAPLKSCGAAMRPGPSRRSAASNPQARALRAGRLPAGGAQCTA